MNKRLFIIALAWLMCLTAAAQTVVHIDDPSSWSTADLAPYVGQTVSFDAPFYVCNNYYSNRLYISPRRVFSPTNQALPSSAEYYHLVSANQSATVALSGISDYHRMGEMIVNLTARVTSTMQLTPVGSVTFTGNTREDLQTPPSLGGRDTLLMVCGMNLEYFLVENLGSGSMGPRTAAQQERQYTKILKALTACDADIYALVEIECGQAALQKLANGLSSTLGHPFAYVNDGGYSDGTYTKAGFVYRTDRVKTASSLLENDNIIRHRKKMQAFIDLRNNEKFTLSINHFKAKTTSAASGSNADQGDGQGTYNYTRTMEAQSVMRMFDDNLSYLGDSDLLVMGDLNAYAKEDPVMVFLNRGMTDLHRFFHADTSYSYVFRGQAGYLDHALASPSLLPQVAGMAAYHINSDEDDRFTYDSSDDVSMFRSSDHDPILVALSLGQRVNNGTILPVAESVISISLQGDLLLVDNPQAGLCHLRLYDLCGRRVLSESFRSEGYTANIGRLPRGMYVAEVFGNQTRVVSKVVLR